MEDKNVFIDEQVFLTTKDLLGYAEEYIVVEHDNPKENLLLNYSLSNSLDEIEIAVFRRTGLNVKLKNACWKINSKLSISVRYLMNKHHVKFTMTTWQEKDNAQIVVNMRSDDIWFYTGFTIIKDNIYSWEDIKTCREIEKIIRDMYNDSSLNDY